MNRHTPFTQICGYSNCPGGAETNLVVLSSQAVDNSVQKSCQLQIVSEDLVGNKHKHYRTDIIKINIINNTFIISTPSSKEPLVYQFRCSISECNKQFVTRPICNPNVRTTSGGYYTSELLHSWWFAQVQSNNKTINAWISSCNIGFVHTRFRSH